MIDARIEIAEIEQMVLQLAKRNVPADFGVAFVGGIAQVAPKLRGRSKLWIIGIGRSGLHSQRMKVAANLAVSLRAARLRDNLDDTAAGMTILRFKSARFDLDLFNEGQVNAGTQSAVGTRPNAQPTKGRVINRHTVRYIGILKSAGAGNGRVVTACLTTVNRARAQVEKARHTALHRNVLKEGICDIGRNGGGGRVHRDGRRADFHNFRNLSGFEDNLDAGGLIDEHFGALDIRGLETRLLHADRINARNQVREEKAALFRGRLNQVSDRPRNGDLSSGDEPLRRIVDQTTQIASRRTQVLGKGRDRE